MVRTCKIKILKESREVNLVWLFCFLFLTFSVLIPLIFVLTKPTIADFKYLLSSNVLGTAIRNTALECVCSTFCSVLIGFIYAYAIVRGDIPLSRFFSFIPLLHLMTPPFVGGLSFLLLLGRNGFITSTLLGLDISLYGFWGLLIAQSLCFFPVAYMILQQVFSGMNPSYEHASYSLGASRFKTFFKVTLPLAWPGILSSMLFIGVSVMSDFGNPMIVAGRYKVLAVEIYTQLTGWLNGGRSAVLGIILMIPSIVLFLLQNKISRKNGIKTATIGGKIQKSEHRKCSLPVRIFLTIFVSFISLCVLAQFLAIVFGSFQRLWGIDVSFTWDHVKALGKYFKEIKNSIFFALLGAFLSTVISCLTAFIVSRTRCPVKKYLDSLCQLPAAVPGSLFGLAFSLFAKGFGIKSSSFMIVLAITVGFMPFSYRIISSSFSQIKYSLDEGAMSLGAGKLKAFITVVLPVSKGSLFYSFVYDFVRGVGTMSAVIFLVSFKTPLASIKILNLAEEGFWGDAAALALLLTLITFAFLGLGRLISLIRGKNGK